jgi:hypothetical protein
MRKRRLSDCVNVHMVLALLTYFLALLVIAWAWKFGGGPERQSALAILGWVVAGFLYHPVTYVSDFAKVDTGLLALDTLLALSLTAIALIANRLWPLFSAGFSIIPLLAHFSVAVEHRGVARAYWAMNQIPFYLILLAVLIGTAAHRQRCATGTKPIDWT